MQCTHNSIPYSMMLYNTKDNTPPGMILRTQSLQSKGGRHSENGGVGKISSRSFHRRIASFFLFFLVLVGDPGKNVFAQYTFLFMYRFMPICRTQTFTGHRSAFVALFALSRKSASKLVRAGVPSCVFHTT